MSAVRFWASPVVPRFLSPLLCKSAETCAKTARTPLKSVSTFSVRLLGSLRWAKTNEEDDFDKGSVLRHRWDAYGH
jgi:hypothetical protein